MMALNSGQFDPPFEDEMKWPRLHFTPRHPTRIANGSKVECEGIL